MSIADRYRAYVDAFELTFDDDDWARIAPFFTADAVYEIARQGEARGRSAVVARLKAELDGFDRKMDSRTLVVRDIRCEGNTIHMNWTVTYTLSGCADLILSGAELAVFEGDSIAFLRDDADQDAGMAMSDWLSSYGDRLE